MAEPDRTTDVRQSEELLRASRTGDERALQELLVRHLDMVRAYVRLRIDPALRQRESVSDVVQSVCRELLSRANRFEYRGEAAFRGWLCEAALNKLRDRHDYHRAQRRDPGREVSPAGEAGWQGLAGVYRTTFDPVGRALRMEEIERLERAFDELPDDQRELLVKRHLCGESYAEIAEQTGRNEASVRKVVSRARARLAELLAAA